MVVSEEGRGGVEGALAGEVEPKLVLSRGLMRSGSVGAGVDLMISPLLLLLLAVERHS